MQLLTTWKELEDLISNESVEGPSLDFKREIPQANEKIAKTICAFANAAGGLIIFGAEYDDQKTRKLKSFPGVSLTPNFDSRVEQIAMNLRPRVVVELSKPIEIPKKKDKVVYVLLVYPGQLQPHQMDDGRFWVRYGSQSGPLPENIIEQMYLAREEHGKKAEELLEQNNYGLPKLISLYKAESYWTAIALIPIHSRKDLLMNSKELRELLTQCLPVEWRNTETWRETHFGYRLMFPRQERGKLAPKEYEYLREVHNNGLIIFSDMDEAHGEQKDFISGNHVLSICSKIFDLATKAYAFSKYGGFLKGYLSLKSIHNKTLFFHRTPTEDKAPFPYESEDGSLKIEIDCSVSDLNSSENIEKIRIKLRQGFGFITP